MIRHVVALISCAFLLAGFPVHAGPSSSDKALAKTLYQQAATDMAQGAYHRACPQFEAALKLDPEHIRTAMTLGMCEDHWGKLVLAQSRFDYARTLAVAQEASEKITEIDALLADLKQRIPKLRIVVPAKHAEDRTLNILRNDISVARADWGKDVAVDPGAHAITVSIPGRGSWKTNVRIQVGQTIEITTGLPDGLSDDRGPAEPTDARAIARPLGFVGIGLGGAGLLAGSILGGLAISKNSASDDGHCNAKNECDKVGTALRLDAQGYGNASTALFIVGGVLATGGIVLIATSSTHGARSLATNSLRVRFGLGHLHLETSW